MKNHLFLLPIIVICQFAGGSIWFSGNTIVMELINTWGLNPHSISYITSAVQFGFIVGSLSFAYFSIADRFTGKYVFCTCAILGSLCNIAIIFTPEKLFYLILLRALTGFFLAGIYPIGMKIASDIYKTGLGKAMGLLVGALALGTAFPHILKASEMHIPWQTILITTSCMACLSGLIMFAAVPKEVKTGSYKFDPRTFFRLLKIKNVRAASFGYFGHMWELYTLWAFTPIFLLAYNEVHAGSNINIPLWSFIVIGSGFIGGSVGGLISIKKGSAWVASAQLSISGMCCLLSPIFFFLPVELLYFFMVIWGICAAGDSPQYSSIIAQESKPDQKGSALTLVNSIGFFITILSIQLTDYLINYINIQYIFWILLPGPLLGLYYMRSFFTKKTA